MESQSSHQIGGRVEQWIALILCVMVLAAELLVQTASNLPGYVETFMPNWIPLAAGLAVVGTMWLNGRSRWIQVRRALLWIGLLLMVWEANGLLFDLFSMVGLMPYGVDWPRLATRMLALAAAVMLARLALMRTNTTTSIHAASWYGYAAFVLALTYPVLRTCWALGSTLGLMYPGAAGDGFLPWLACTPWLLAAALSLILATNRRWMPRWMVLTAGWSSTAIVATIAPAACWSLITKSVIDGDLGMVGIAAWVPCLFYGSWFLWFIAAAAATRAYQLRSARE